MRFFRDLTIRRKLTALMMLSSVATLLLACVAWLGHDWRAQRGAMVQELSLMGEIIAHSSSAAVDFNMPTEMERALSVLAEHSPVRRAVLFDNEGQVLYGYSSAEGEVAAWPIEYRPKGLAFEGGSLLLWTPVEDPSGRTIGTLALESDFRELHRRQAEFMGIVSLVLLVCLLVAFGMSYKLQEVISGPIMLLAGTMRAVSDKKDYGLRARRTGRDEIGFLTGVFNEMLEAIQSRDGELSQSRSSLEEEVGQRTRDLTEKNEQLRESMQETRAAGEAKSQFLANMSHEIRTPMNGIVGMNALLLDSPLDNQQRSYAELVKGSADSLLDIINDILDFSKIEAGKMTLEQIDFDMTKSVEDVVSLLSNDARSKGLDLLCSFDPKIPSVLAGDPTRVRQVITNLVGNAVKFTEHGCVTVHVDFLENEGEDVWLKVLVHDTGIGIDESKTELLFNSFSQVDAATNRKYGGTGLGLAISQQLVRLMDGEIGVESTPGTGSTFWFTLRLATAEVDSDSVFELPGGVDAPRIVVADASAATVEVLSRQAEAWGFEVVACHDAEGLRSALEASRSAKTIAVVDVTLVQSDERLHADFAKLRATSGASVILTSWRDETTTSDSTRDSWLTKPIRPTELFQHIATLAQGDTPARPLAPVAPVSSTTEHRSESLRVLLAEDNQINQMVATKILQRSGFSPEVVDDGAKAVEAVKGMNIDVVLMDCQMPGMDGFKATRCIREWELKTGRVERVHIIALTANAMTGDRERCIDAGMDDYLSKPVDPVVLIEKLKALQSEGHDALERVPAAVPSDAPGPPFDCSDLLARFKGRRPDLRAAIADLDRRAVDCLGRIKYCLDAEYGDQARSLVVELRAALALISSGDLHSLAIELAHDVECDAFSDARGTFASLQSEFARCRAYLPEILALSELD